MAAICHVRDGTLPWSGPRAWSKDYVTRLMIRTLRAAEDCRAPRLELLVALLPERGLWFLAELAKSACREWCRGVRSSQVCQGQSGQW